MTHTPGPWHSVGHNIEDDNGKVVATTEAPNGDEFPRAGTNRRLIAAAPELLEALKEIAEGKGRFSQDPLTHASNTIEDMIEIAHNAIAKAEGK